MHAERIATHSRRSVKSYCKLLKLDGQWSEVSGNVIPSSANVTILTWGGSYHGLTDCLPGEVCSQELIDLDFLVLILFVVLKEPVQHHMSLRSDHFLSM